MHTVADPAGLRQQPQFQTPVEAHAQKAHAALPLAHGRIEKAVAIVLSGGGTLHPEGHAVTAGWPSLSPLAGLALTTEGRRNELRTLPWPHGDLDTGIGPVCRDQNA